MCNELSMSFWGHVSLRLETKRQDALSLCSRCKRITPLHGKDKKRAALDFLDVNTGPFTDGTIFFCGNTQNISKSNYALTSALASGIYLDAFHLPCMLSSPRKVSAIRNIIRDL